jgi:predicted ATPase
LNVALLRAEPGPGGLPERAAAAATASVLRALAADRPLLVAIDDAQWLDTPSGEALAFAAHRLANAPICLLLAVRLPVAATPLSLDRALADGRLVRLRPEPFSAGALYHLLATKVEHSFPRPMLTRIAEASGGNPFYALEIAR